MCVGHDTFKYSYTLNNYNSSFFCKCSAIFFFVSVNLLHGAYPLSVLVSVFAPAERGQYAITAAYLAYSNRRISPMNIWTFTWTSKLKELKNKNKNKRNPIIRHYSNGWLITHTHTHIDGWQTRMLFF